MSASSKCLQISLCVLNLIFLLFGVLIVIPGSMLLAKSTDDSTVHSLGFGLIAVGGASIFVGMLGCMGSFIKSRGLLVFYAMLLVCLIIAQCVFGGVAMSTSVSDERIHDFSKSIWDVMSPSERQYFQEQAQCCYFRTINDFGLKCATENMINFKLCGAVMDDTVRSAIQGSSIYMFVSAFVEVIAIVIAMVLIFDHQKRDYDYRY